MCKHVVAFLGILLLLLPLSAQETSPDLSTLDPNTTFVFEYNRDIHVTDFTQEPINLTRSESRDDQMPLWSPDGREIAFLSGEFSNARQSLHIMTLETREIRALGSLELTAEADIAWSPDAKTIAVALGGLFFIDTETGVETPLTDLEYVRSPTWSPDGSRLAVEARGEIYILTPDDGTLTQVSDPENISWGPVWSPVSEEIIFVSNTETHPILYKVDAATLSVSPVIEMPSHSHIFFDHQWSPDGQKIAFYAYSEHDTEPLQSGTNVYLVNIDGSDMRMISDDQDDHLLGWLRDGTHILYWARESGGIDGTLNVYSLSDDSTAILDNPWFDSDYAYTDFSRFVRRP